MIEIRNHTIDILAEGGQIVTPHQHADKPFLPDGRAKILNKYVAFKIFVLDEWLISDLSKADIEFIFELSERRDTTSTLFCTPYKQERVDGAH